MAQVLWQIQVLAAAVLALEYLQMVLATAATAVLES
jgi:hypothetical protein